MKIKEYVCQDSSKSLENSGLLTEIDRQTCRHKHKLIPYLGESVPSLAQSIIGALHRETFLFWGYTYLLRKITLEGVNIAKIVWRDERPSRVYDLHWYIVYI